MKNTKSLLFSFFIALIIPLSFHNANASPVTAVISSYTNASCNGQGNGSATVTASNGTSPYTYYWSTSPAQTNATATGLSAGNYTITVTDAASNTATASVVITQPYPLTDTASIMGRVACNGGNGGVAFVHPAGGTPPYTYVWTPFGGTSDTVTGLSAGCYTVTTGDANGCTATSSICLTQPNQLVVNAFIFSNILCNGGNGCVAANVSGGSSPYTYMWDGGQTTYSACGVIAGTYTVSVTDLNGCSASSVATLTQPSVLTANITINSSIQCNGGLGSLSANVSGGVAPYSYTWVPAGGTNNPATGMTAGCYTVFVTDNNNCSASANICISQPTPITITGTTTIDTGGCSGSANDVASGGTPPYTYLWSNGATTASVSNLCAAVYCCLVTDNHGCVDTNCLTVNSCSNSFDEQICIVTLDTVTNKCEIIWGRTNSPPSGGYGNYNIYSDTNNTDILIHSQPLNVLSEYIDPTSNPSAGPVSYKISTVDSCGESSLSAVHTSIYLTTTAGFNVYILNWTAYVGFTPLEYVIFRGPSLSQLAPIDTVANNIYTFHDTLPPLGSYYVLEAVSPLGPCIPSAHKANGISFSLLSGAYSNGFNTGTLLGINNFGNAVNNFKVYPNPSTGSFTVSYSVFTADNVTISIINELGQCVYQEQKNVNTGINTEQLNLGNVASGIYSLRIQTNNGITVKKLLIMPSK